MLSALMKMKTLAGVDEERRRTENKTKGERERRLEKIFARTESESGKNREDVGKVVGAVFCFFDKLSEPAWFSRLAAVSEQEPAVAEFSTTLSRGTLT
jgi:hypothetical protein